MAKVRLSGPADADARALLAVSREHVGTAGEARYAAVLAAATRMIAADPDGPNTRDRPELGPGVRCLHTRRARGAGGVRAPVHVIYFRTEPSGTIVVLRILHERMDPTRHLVPAPTKRAPARKRLG